MVHFDTIQDAVNALEENKKDLTRVDLSGLAFDELSATRISKACDRNDTCQVLNVSNCNVDDKGGKKIWDSLKKNKSITTVNFKTNKLRDEACMVIGECLIDNAKITSIDLASNEFGIVGAEALATALEKNKSLVALSLACNNITLKGIEKFADTLQSWTKAPIARLDLRGTAMSDQGVTRISEAIEKKGTVAQLYLSYNGIGDAGAKPIAELLSKKTPLSVLDLRGNIIEYEGAKLIAAALARNKGMQELYVGYNRITAKGINLISEAEKKQGTVCVDGAREALQEAGPDVESEPPTPPPEPEPVVEERPPTPEVEEQIEAADVGTVGQELRGQKYDKALLKLATKSMKDGSIDLKEAKKLWKSAMDQRKVTDAEAKTLQWIIAEHNVEEDAKDFLIEKLGFKEVKVHGSIQWFEKDLLELADKLAKDGSIDKEDGKKLWTAAMDQKKVTDFEAKTLQYIITEYKVAEEGKQFLLEKMGFEEVEGKWYEKDLLTKANKAMKDGKIDLKEAKKLWKAAMDGKNVTDIEVKTLQYIAAKFQIQDNAKKFLFEKLGFQEIEGQWYEAALLKLAIDLQADADPKSSGGVVNLLGAQKLWKSAMDAGTVTEIEATTLRYIISNNQFEEDAKKFLEDQLSLVS